MKNARTFLITSAVIVLGLVALVLPLPAGQANGQPRTDAKVPLAVALAVQVNCPGAAIDKMEVEKEAVIELYDFEFKAGRGEIEVAADGTVMDIASIVALKDIPKPAADAILKAAAGAKIGQLERSEIRAEIVKTGGRGAIVKLAAPRCVYEAELVRGKERGEVQVAPDGQVVEGPKWGADEEEAEEAPGGYHLLKKHVLGGEGGWDYMALDGRTRLLYVTHGSAVEILNVDTGVKGQPITGLQGVHGVAFAPERDRGYISNGRGNSVTVFDLKTGQVLAEVPSSGQNPDSVMYDAFSDRVFTFNGRTANATAIDAATDKVVGTVDIGGKPEFAMTDGKGTIFVNNEDTSEVVAFDARTLQVKRRWSIAPGEGPSGLAIDLKNKRLFSVCDKVMVVSDFENGKIVTTVPIGDGPDAVRYDPGTGLVFASNGGDGTLTVVRQEAADEYSVIGTVPTARGARTMELDLQTHHVFVVTAEYGPAPAPTAEQPRPRPAIVPGSFMVLEFGK